ncbi:28 kDa heat- and acid-stable phosphoprotein-like, partial [Trifolium medium]|nr:28 kDa heat- and acid-stable phosphoprotein-like [Trifolium medium]
VEIEKQRAHECYMKLQAQGKTEQSRKDLDCLAEEKAEAAKKREEKVDGYVLGGGIPKARVGGKSIKNLHRKNRSVWNLPYWKPFLMALPDRKKQRVKERTAACVKMAAKICHSSKSEESEDDLFIKKFLEERKATILEREKNYFNRMPTFIGYSDDYKGLVNDYY